VREVEPAAPLSNVAAMTALFEQSLGRPQSLSMLVTSFAVVALLLSVIGIYGVMGYYVQQHLKEISIRIALGGSQGHVVKMIIGQGMTVVAAGTLAGLAIAFATTRLMSSLLFDVGATDPAAYVTAGAVLLAVAAMACAVPAFRVIRLQPAVVLRNE
jgi:putative ABC transport system permease protein